MSRWTPFKHDPQHSPSAHFSVISQAHLFTRMQTSLQGLSNIDVIYRRQLCGLNELTVETKESLISKFFEQFNNPLILMLFGSATLSVVLGQVDDAISITLVFILNSYLFI